MPLSEEALLRKHLNDTVKKMKIITNKERNDHEKQETETRRSTRKASKI